MIKPEWKSNPAGIQTPGFPFGRRTLYHCATMGLSVQPSGYHQALKAPTGCRWFRSHKNLRNYIQYTGYCHNRFSHGVTPPPLICRYACYLWCGSHEVKTWTAFSTCEVSKPFTLNPQALTRSISLVKADEVTDKITAFFLPVFM